MPTYPDIRLALTTPWDKSAGASQRPPPITSTSSPKGPLGLMARRACLKEGRPVHDQLPHALSRISERAAAGSRGADLCLAAPLPQRRRGDAGGDAVACRRACRQGFHEAEAVDARRRYRAFQSEPSRRSRPAAAGVSLCRPRRGREEPAARSSSSTCPAARSWSATGRRSAELKARYPDAHFMGEHTGARSCADLCVVRRVRVSEPHRHVRHRAARRRWRAACRWQPTRSPGRSTSSATGRPACCPRISARRRWAALTIDRRQGARKGARLQLAGLRRDFPEACAGCVCRPAR